MINKYRLNIDEKVLNFLLYHPTAKVPTEGLSLELLEENIDLIKNVEDWNIPIYNVFDFVTSMLMKKKRTRDKVLEEVGISTWNDLIVAYNGVMNKTVSLSKRERDFVKEKYSEIVNMPSEPIEEKVENPNEGKEFKTLGDYLKSNNPNDSLQFNMVK